MTVEQQLRQQLARSKRVVVKVGSQALCLSDGRLDGRTIAGLCQDLAQLLDEGRQVVLVSSGAVASGTGEVGAGEVGRERGLGKQALAAIGQPLLMARYRMEMQGLGRQVAQVLLTHADLADRGRFLHARRVLAELLAAGILPIVNENDTISVDELRFGDNDQLAAQVAHVVEADALLLLTEVDGLYTAHPNKDPTAKLIHFVGLRDAQALSAAEDGTSAFGSGGMKSKLLAAKKAGSVGVVAAIARGKRPGIAPDLLRGEPLGTVVQPSAKPLSGKRSWVATSLRPRGTLHVDAGAAQALAQGGRSLLPAGVVRVEGRFQVGDAVAVVGPTGQLVARGLVRYASEEASKICGLRTDQIAAALGWLPADELIHRDDLVLADA